MCNQSMDGISRIGQRDCGINNGKDQFEEEL
jgi:hypothetical protein